MDHPSIDERLPLPRIRRPSLSLARRSKSERVLGEVLARAGVTLGGGERWDIRVLHERFYDRVLSQGSMGLGESYMDGWWECERIDELAFRLLRAHAERAVKKDWRIGLAALGAKLTNQQTIRRATQVARVHYDLGNSFFQRMLGPTMAYSCAVWKGVSTLDEAQTQKFDLICRKLDLRRGDRLLDIGCGWGGLARHAAEHYGCSVTGITISEKQHEYATESGRGLPIRVLLADYRSPELQKLEPFDKIVSVGMFEHVGAKNYAAFMQVAHGMLKERGLFLLQCIGHQGSIGFDPWINRYIFPNSHLPNAGEVAGASSDSFVLEDWQNLGADYDKTLMAWHANFEAYAHSADFNYDRRFYRMWRYYLLICAGSFRTRSRTQLWQIVLSKGGIPGGYATVR
jgi:cyclopropane-fatty-acyl-phospholipid synthase